MSVVSVKELYRKNVYEVLKPRQLTREFVLVLSDDAIASPINENVPFDAGVIPDLGDVHPTYAGYRVRKVTYTEGYEGSPYHVHVVCEYGVIYGYELVSPVDRASLWEFDGDPGEVPAFYYYDGSGNATTYPLTNSAYDYFPGLVTEESTVAARVTKNFASLPTSWIGAQNFVNDATYLGCPAHTIKVRKVTVLQTQEEFGGGIVAYWKATAELHYRQSGHNLLLPDIGWNFLDSGSKYRCMVFDDKNVEWTPSPNPVGLNGAGAQTFGAPAILTRRVNPETNFSTLFGSPPTTPPPLAT